MRIDAQALDELLLYAGGRTGEARCPQRNAAERALEILDGARRDGVGHLLVEARIAFAGRQALLRQQVWRVEHHRCVAGRLGLGIARHVHLAGGIDVDHFEVLADRAGT